MKKSNYVAPIITLYETSYDVITTSGLKATPEGKDAFDTAWLS